MSANREEILHIVIIQKRILNRVRRDSDSEFNIKSSRDQNSKGKSLKSKISKFKSFKTNNSGETSEPNKLKKRKTDFNINENNITY